VRRLRTHTALGNTAVVGAIPGHGLAPWKAWPGVRIPRLQARA